MIDLTSSAPVTLSDIPDDLRKKYEDAIAGGATEEEARSLVSPNPSIPDVNIGPGIIPAIIPTPEGTPTVSTISGIPSGTGPILQPIGELGAQPIATQTTEAPLVLPKVTDASKQRVVNSDGSITTGDGITFYPSTGEFSHRIGGQTLLTGIDGRTRVLPPEKSSQLHDSVMKELMNRKISPFDANGQPLAPNDAFRLINEYDTKNGILSPAQEKIAAQASQQLNSSRNPSVAGFYKIKPKYDSIVENITAKPLDQRNGTDDAYLLNAAAGIENVDRAPTQNDYKEMLRAAGIRGNLEVTSERLWGLFNNDPNYYQDRATRILSDAQVQQIQSNAERVLRPRADLFLKAIEPVRNRLRSHGIPEENAIPMGLLDDIQTPASPSPTPSVTPPLDAKGQPIIPGKPYRSNGKTAIWKDGQWVPQ